MNISVDLHSHSGYAGGVGKIELTDVSATMKMKGIDVFATGDILLPARYNCLEKELVCQNNGLYKLHNNDKSNFLLQTEIILTVKLAGYKNKTVAHHVILFPDFKSIKKMAKLMDDWGQKNTIGRPFIVSDSREQMVERLFAITNIDPRIEIIPAHIMTPDGVLGCKNMLESIEEFYGDFLANIHAVETGLSADPPMLEQIPYVSDLTLISNSDCHSAALNRIGREFTNLNIDSLSYEQIITSIRENKVNFTAEFNPAEGRYYRTGHASKRHVGKDYYILSDEDKLINKCPICGKKMVIGVYDRVKQLADRNILALKRKFYPLIPLIEVVAYSLELKSITSKRVIEVYMDIIALSGTEIALWACTESEIIELLDKRIPLKTMYAIIAVKKGQFKFDPPGFDGEYGKLKIKNI